MISLMSLDEGSYDNINLKLTPNDKGPYVQPHNEKIFTQIIITECDYAL